VVGVERHRLPAGQDKSRTTRGPRVRWMSKERGTSCTGAGTQLAP
jgi:hypothetical protein